uniref:NADH-ubiquinone oxidoreductase chain 5 n=1 Tax=Eucnemidae sp. 4 ACP-2013 TaxID=1434503 RepID=A0A3G4RY40_9COLE|nr:NADH dehydrogenase subunit 5 [Eucnemidae sp. 4 ACP-2013]
MNLCLIYFSLFLVLSLMFFFFSIYLINMSVSYMIEFHIFSLNSSDIYYPVLFDWMSSMFLSLVLFISCMVIFYSMDYMSGDYNINRFIILVVLFVCSMIFFIISPNLISIMLGWDGLGLVSYCLIIYYQNWKSFNAGMLTVLTNRIGDVALLICIAWMLNYGSWNFIYYLNIMKDDYYMKLIAVLVILASMIKSAQIPFSSWLPAAMAAPTPVSSLVHSSTLVTAGVYLLIRFNYIFNDYMMNILLYFSVLTMFMAGLGANFEFDLKKIIALSTLSQLGLMISVLALGDYILSFFHLLTHALFKALLFMCAGSIIHCMNNNQDIRFMGGIYWKLPLTSCMFNLCNFSLCGLPFLSGFYSKDLVLEFFMMGNFNWLIVLLYFSSIGFTIMYSVRLSYFSLMGVFNFNELNNISDSNYNMLKGQLGLLFLTIISGSMLMWLILPSLYFIFLPLLIKLLVIIMMIISFYLGYEFYLINYHGLKSLKYLNISMFLGSMWNLYIISTSFSSMNLVLGNNMHYMMDNGWLEYYGGTSLYSNIGSSFYYLNLLFLGLKIMLFMFICWVIMLNF